MIPPYGASQLIDNIISDQDLDDAVDAQETRLLLSDSELDVCNRIADGSLTPLNGFMTREDVISVIHESRLSNGLYYPVPIIQSIPKSIYDSRPDRIIITDQTNTPLGYLDVTDYYTLELQSLCQPLFGTNSSEHPGVIKFTSQSEYLVAGKIMMVKPRGNLNERCMSPQQIRAEIKSRSLGTVTAFHTRNVPHLGHEYLQRMALEITDGLLVHPIVGWKKEGDYTSEAVLRAYTFLCDGYYPAEQVILSGLKIATFYAGPREAPWHAIIRQNFGCSHIVIGRDHAGVGGFYGPDEAHKLVMTVQDDLAIRALKVMGPYYCRRCGMVVTSRTCGHDLEDKEDISGTSIREAISGNSAIPSHLVRPDLIEHMLEIPEVFISGSFDDGN